MQYLEILTHIVLILSLGWYLITNLQWYNYKLDRVVIKHHKQQWHIIYFISPIVIYYLLDGLYFDIYFYFLYLSSFIIWNKNLDKPLILTPRVKRYLIILLFTTFVVVGLCFLSNKTCHGMIIVPLVLTWAISSVLEKIFFINFKHKAKQKLKTFNNLEVIAITASYGKTSIKNYLYQVLSKKYNVYMTPRSVNTLAGIVQDVNDDLPRNTQIYIAEAGARAQGDIKEIVEFIEPHYAIIGKVGEQHIEYFKTLDNIIHTKMEILKSSRLKHGFVHQSIPIKKYDTITTYPHKLEIIRSDLEGIWFDLEINGTIEHFYSPILGRFSAINLTAVILLAHKLGMQISEIKLALNNLKPVAHRLHLSKVGGKIILDDSFNGNLEGMIEAIAVSSTYDGRKVIITPGLVESTMESNVKLAKAIDDNFDLVIITGQLNAKLLQKTITKTKVIMLPNKQELEEVLIKHTTIGDLILFANDAPNFI